MFLIFDTETTGLPLRDDAPLTDFENWPRVVQIAWQLHDDDGSPASASVPLVQNLIKLELSKRHLELPVGKK